MKSFVVKFSNKKSILRFLSTKSIKPDFPGAPKAKITHDLNFISEWKEVWPVYRILDEEGNIENEKEFEKVNLPEKELLHLYECCVRLNCMDDILYNAQRQGRVSFYMTNFGEECSQVGSAHALKPNDESISKTTFFNSFFFFLSSFLSIQRSRYSTL